MKSSSRNSKREIRHERSRSKIAGTAIRPRLSVYKSNAHLFVQLIDDDAQKTIASSSSVQLKIKLANNETAAKIGTDIAKKAKALNIKKIVFDKGGSKYHGNIETLAEAARKEGLEF